MKITIKNVLPGIALGLLGVLLFAGCSAPWAHNKSAKPGTRPTAQQLIAAAQKNFASVSSFHVIMQVQNPGKAEQGQVQIRNASGDVLMPDKVKAQATVILSGQAVTVDLISIGDSQYITDPITGQWRVIKGVLDPRTLTNPKTGIVSVFDKLQNVSQPTPDVVNGVQCWRINGQLDSKHIAFITGGGASKMLPTSACIGRADALPYQVSVTGQAAPGDSDQTSRIFILSDYNKNVNISAPPL
ncbi:MAG: LppX_LprAFG lipoprotein [Ktedonobacteraceae bacterium]|nr:LppX_LprAFG lipoprotein [Ktedonobacteraceae bacterium]MBO0792697.1 LppX_LprAFG lipoprotein [Ktedonobacteraceae bacterium]